MEEKDLERIQKLFADNGYVIENVSVFAREADSAELTNIVRKLNELERKINTGIDYKSLAESCDASVARIKDALSSSETYDRSIPEHKATFESALAAITGKFDTIRNYMRAEEMMKEKQEMWFEVRRSLYELGKRKDISDAERTNEALRLTLGATRCEKAYKDAVQFCNDQKRAMEKTIDGINLTDFKNQFFRDLNVLELNTKDSVTSKLAIDDAVKELINEVTREMRNAVAFYGITSLQSQHEFDALCKRYGLAKKEGFKKDMGTVTPDIPTPDEPGKGKDAPEQPAKPKSSEPAVEMKYREFVSALRKANPQAKILTDFNESFILCDKTAEELVLPPGFEYDPKVGITNQNNLKEGKPITVNVKPLLAERKPKGADHVKGEGQDLNPDQDKDRRPFDPKRDMPPTLGQRAKDGTEKLKAGVKHKVTQVRKAGMAGYVKGMLLCGGVLALAAGSAFALPAAALGAGIGAGLNALRLKVIKEINAKFDAFNEENYNDPKLSPIQKIEKMRDALAGLKYMYRVNKAKKAYEDNYQPVVPEQPEVEPQVVSETEEPVVQQDNVDDPDKKYGLPFDPNGMPIPLGAAGLPNVDLPVEGQDVGRGGR